VKDLNTKNYKMMLKENKDLNKLIVRPSILGLEVDVNMAIFSKAIYRFSATLTKISMAFSAEIERSLLKFILNCKRAPNNSQRAKIIVKKKNEIEFILQNLLQRNSNQNRAWYWHETLINIRETKINLNIFSQLIFFFGWGVRWEDRTYARQVL
jgi:hypothetical protein